MKQLELIRVNNCNGGMQGCLRFKYRIFAFTLEPPWRDNQRNKSCIPAGIYSVRLGMSPKRRYNVWWVRGVSGRKHIQMHKGARLKHTLGCIIVCDMFDVDNKGNLIALHSTHAWKELMGTIKPDNEFILTIKDHYIVPLI